MIITRTCAPSLAAPSAQNIGYIFAAKLASLSTQCHSARGAMIPAADNATQGETAGIVARLAVAIIRVMVHAAGLATTAPGRGLVDAFIAARHPVTADAIQTTLVIKATCATPTHVSTVDLANVATLGHAK